MDWHKMFNKDVLFTEMNPSEFLSVCKYRALYYELEREPKINELKVFLSKKQIEFATKFLKSEKHFIESSIDKVNLKRENDKKNKLSSREKTENVACESSTSSERIADESNAMRYIEREVIDKSITKSKKDNTYYNMAEFPKSFLPVINEVINVYNTVMADCPLWPQLKMSSMTDKRKNKIKSLWDKKILKDISEWEEYFFTVKNSDFHKDEKFGNIDGILSEGFVIQIREGNHGAFLPFAGKPGFYYRKYNGTIEFRKKIDGKLITANPNY